MVNSSSEYYNSICYPATSESGTDITLKDRKKLFIEDNKTICQDDCIFSEYNYITKRAECSCNVKQSPLSFADMYINSTKLYNNFIDIKNIANINILICYNILLCKKGILKNIGSYIIILIIIFHIISFFIFCVKYTHEIKNKIKNIIHKIKNLKLIHNNDKSKKEQKNKKFIKNFSKNNKSKDNDTNKIFINSKKSLKKSNKNIRKINKNNNMINFGKNSNIKTNRNKASFNANKNIINNIRNNFTYNNVISKNKFKKVNKKSATIKKTSSGQITKIVEYNDDEINNFSYELAIKLDKRTYCQYYFSLLKTKHNLLFSFFYNKDYNLIIIKIDLFFIGFVIYYTTNALFYSDDTMHQIYEDEGSFNFIYQLPKIIYSSLISIILNTLLKLLALSNNRILKLKKIKSMNNIKKKKLI